MSPALVHGMVDRWLLDHEGWITEGGPTRLALCEDWHKVSVEFGAGHPAALGCLLAIMREAWGERDVEVSILHEGGALLTIQPSDDEFAGERSYLRGSLVEAIAAALLEAVP